MESENKDIEFRNTGCERGWNVFYKGEYAGYTHLNLEYGWMYSSGMAVKRYISSRDECVRLLLEHVKDYCRLKYWYTDPQAKTFCGKVSRAVQLGDSRAPIIYKLQTSGITVNEYRLVLDALKENHL